MSKTTVTIEKDLCVELIFQLEHFLSDGLTPVIDETAKNGEFEQTRHYCVAMLQLMDVITKLRTAMEDQEEADRDGLPF